MDPARTGAPLTAFVQLRCALNNCLLRTTRSEDFPEVVEIHKLSGEQCSLLKVRTASLADFEGLVDRLGQGREMRTHIALSTQYERRSVQRRAVPSRDVPPAEGWSGS